METTYLTEQYQERAEKFQAEAERLRKKYMRYALVRLLVFFGGIGLLIVLFQIQWLIGLGSSVLFLLGFYRLNTWHLGIKQNQLHHQALVEINQNELLALQHEFQQYGDGAAFLDVLHPNAVDLDLFGPYSFFQYTNRTTTQIGAQQLANYLTQGVGKDEIMSRQEAIADLKEQLDWRQRFFAFGIRTEDSIQQVELLYKWLEQPTFIFQNKLLRVALIGVPILTILGFVYCMYLQIFWLALVCLLPSFLILRQYVLRVNQVHQQTTHAEKALKHYAGLIAHIEKGSFQSERLLQLQKAFQPAASKKIERLSYIIGQLNARYNAFAILFNLFGLWDLQWVLSLEKWKLQQKGHLRNWFEALAAFETLSSLATTAYNNPDWSNPEIVDTLLIKATDLAHPLIAQQKRVANSMELPTKGHIKLLTGSNMAGKSTLLRTVGLNIVLAMAGAPVCAKRFSLPLLQVYTSMRTQDALHESTSSFYAELKRLKVIIEAVEQGENIFFLLDEILKGTNSRDRHTGSKALIQQLIEQGGGGIIATHDLELGSLEAQYGGTIENWCMEVSIKDGQLDFDYLLKKGVSQSFNATLLMQQMGIAIQ